MTRGIYQKGNWVILQKDDGSRTALSKGDYENGGYSPYIESLDTDLEDDVQQLAGLASSNCHRAHGKPGFPASVPAQ